MKIRYTPQRNDDILNYEFGNDSVKVNGKSYDFSTFTTDGEMEDLEYPFTQVKRENGELFVEVIKPYGKNATEGERFPSQEWEVVS